MAEIFSQQRQHLAPSWGRSNLEQVQFSTKMYDEQLCRTLIYEDEDNFLFVLKNGHSVKKSPLQGSFRKNNFYGSN